MSAPVVPAPADNPTLARYLSRWLCDVVGPNLEPATHAYYEVMVRRYVIPALGSRRLGALQVRDVQAWLDSLATTCQCCAQGKDAARPEGQRRCCAIGHCCQSYAGPRTIQAARNTLRVALNHARTTGLVTPNVAAYASVPAAPRRRLSCPVWSRQEASRFLTSARDDSDPLYAGYILILVNALCRGELLGLTWSSVDLDLGELDISWQLQRVRGQLIHKRRAPTMNSSFGDKMPLPHICAIALKLRRDQQAAAREAAGDRWQDSDLVFTTRWGTPIEPRNFNRSFAVRCAWADVSRIRVHDIRRTCASLLWELNIHPAIVLRVLRHAPIATTMAIGTEISDELVRAALNKLGDSLSLDSPVQRDQS